MSIVLNGVQLDIPGLNTICWLDDPVRVPRITNTSHRSRYIRSIVVHTVRGQHGKLLAGAKSPDPIFMWTQSQRTRKNASWDFTIGTSGLIACQSDPVTSFSWHATQINPVSIGLEMVQEDSGDLFAATIDATCKLIAFLCEQLGVQKQLPWEPASDKPYAGRIERMDPGFNGADCVGVFGHRNVWVYPDKNATKLVAARGPGDPGDDVFRKLATDYGFERHVFHGKDPQDLRVWKGRQRAIGFDGSEVDGIPLTRTTARLKELGHRNGQWIDPPMSP